MELGLTAVGERTFSRLSNDLALARPHSLAWFAAEPRGRNQVGRRASTLILDVSQTGENG